MTGCCLRIVSRLARAYALGSHSRRETRQRDNYTQLTEGGDAQADGDGPEGKEAHRNGRHRKK